MCSSKSKTRLHQPTTMPKINGRPVLQPKSNQVPTLERRNSLQKNSPKSPLITSTPSLSPPLSPKLKSPRPVAVKRGNDLNGLNSSADKVFTTPRSTIKLKKPKSANFDMNKQSAAAALIVEAPGSIAAARREQVAIMQEQRKSRIAHYGRTKPAKLEGKVVVVVNNNVESSAISPSIAAKEEKRCSFITPNSDPIYVAYHDQEWGVPVHDDKLLFELLVLTGAQVGSDWTSVLKKREAFREAFSGFDAEDVAKFSEKKITSISAEYGMDISQVRGVVDNSKRILEVKNKFGSFDKYLWGFVNHKPICTQYRTCQKIPVKTSKSETISKDMVKRGFRLVGPTVIHSFMQAAGLSNDHLITCPRHLQCNVLAPASPTSS